MHKQSTNNTPGVGLSRGFENNSCSNSSSTGNTGGNASTACEFGFTARNTGSVEEMAESPNATGTGLSGNSDYGAQSRMPPAGPFDPYLPDSNIGLSPKVTNLSPPSMTPGSTSNSESNNIYRTSRNTSYSESQQQQQQQQAQNGPVPAWMTEPAPQQPSMIGEFPAAANWQQQTQSSTTNAINDPLLANNPAKAFTDMDVVFDLPTPSEFNITGMTPGPQESDTMLFGQQTTIPMRGNNGETMTTTTTSMGLDGPGSWNITGGTGMTPGYDGMVGGAEWDNLMEGLAEWDPSTLDGGLIPPLD